jgi:hypothetical protein
MYLQKVISKKTRKNYFLLASWRLCRKKQDPEPDPLVRGMDPRIRIRTKMSQICNTGSNIMLMWVSPRSGKLNKLSPYCIPRGGEWTGTCVYSEDLNQDWSLMWVPLECWTNSVLTVSQEWGKWTGTCVCSEDLNQDWSERQKSDQMLLQRVKERNKLPIAAMKAGSCTLPKLPGTVQL